jgi:threonine 3-dehydrogenase
MLHAAAFLSKNNKENYECKIDKNTKLPFIGIHKAVESIIQLMSADNIKSKLRTFNIEEVSLTPNDIIGMLQKEFPKFNINYNIEEKLQSVADTWPDSLNCEKAKKEWSFSNKHDKKSFFMEYLIPTVKEYYGRH